jgi:hypothetical protein
MILSILNLDAFKAASAFFLIFCAYLLVSYLCDPYGIRKYPGPFVAKFTYAWILWVGITLRRTKTIHEAHQKYGISRFYHLSFLLNQSHRSHNSHFAQRDLFQSADSVL